MSDGDTPLLLDRLLAWLLRLVNAGEKPLVLRKVCSSLIAYFLSPSDLWEHCVRHLICCFFVDTVVPRQSLSQYPSTAELLGKFTQLQRLTTLWFCMNLVEELGKTDFASIQTYKSLIHTVYTLKFINWTIDLTTTKR